MATHSNAHKSLRHRAKALLAFSKQYYIVSVLATIALAVYAYKDIFYLKFQADLFAGRGNYSEQTKEMLLGGANARLVDSFFSGIPIIFAVTVIVLLAYILFRTYRHTYASLKIHTFYTNLKKTPISNIVMHYTVIYAAFFVVPLLFWSLYLIVWFPLMTKIPLQFLLNDSLWPLIASSVGVLFALTLMTQIGLVTTRLSANLYRRRQ